MLDIPWVDCEIHRHQGTLSDESSGNGTRVAEFFLHPVVSEKPQIVESWPDETSEVTGQAGTVFFCPAAMRGVRACQEVIRESFCQDWGVGHEFVA